MPHQMQGADRPDIDFEAAWRRELGEPTVKQTGGQGWLGSVVRLLRLGVLSWQQRILPFTASLTLPHQSCAN